MVKLISDTLHAAGLPFRFTVYPRKRIRVYLNSGQVDIFAGLRGSEAISDHVLYSPAAIDKVSLRVYTLNDGPIPDTVAALKNNNLGMIRMFRYPGIRVVLTAPDNDRYITHIDRHKAGLMMLKQGHIEYLLQYKNAMEETLKMLPTPGLRYITLEQFDVYLMISRKTPGAERLMKLFSGQTG